jgi:hypothetical protein
VELCCERPLGPIELLMPGLVSPWEIGSLELDCLKLSRQISRRCPLRSRGVPAGKRGALLRGDPDRVHLAIDRWLERAQTVAQGTGRPCLDGRVESPPGIERLLDQIPPRLGKRDRIDLLNRQVPDLAPGRDRQPDTSTDDRKDNPQDDRLLDQAGSKSGGGCGRGC